ncbi:phage portal protein [Halonatronum saccharophilum]|uniref:phage portal protein n=1 Tax=Halonatronum saccharophilum TaxID=150060 RepID=UPI0004824D75|nr:phage portal protein [Halonatronum saccharophilum]
MSISNAERANRFYNNEVYDNDYINEFDLFDEIEERFNPIPKIISIMAALALRKEIGIEITEKSDIKSEISKAKIEEIWEDNSIQDMKYQIAIDLLLNKKAYIELVKKEDSIILVLHDPDNVDYKAGQYCKIEGIKESFDFTNKEFKEVEVVKEYYNVKEGVESYRRLIEVEGGEEVINQPLAYDFIPVIELTTDYDLGPALDKIDNINEMRAFAHNIFYLHGDPPIIQSGEENKKMGQKSKDKMRTARGKQVKILNIGENQLKYLEMQGNVLKVMLEDIKELKLELENEYPEYVLASILSKGNPSGDAIEQKAIEIINRVESFRSDLDSGLTKVNNLALRMLGENTLDHNIAFGGILPSNIKSLVDVIKELRAIKMISKKTGLDKLHEFIKDSTAELKQILEEDGWDKSDIERALEGDDI